MVDCIKQTARESGVRGLFTGTCATLLRDVPASFTYFITYEYLKTQFIDEKTGKISTPSTLLAGGLAGVTNWLVGLPADTLKSRVQTAAPGVYPRGVRDAFATLIRTEGPTALYRGLLPVLLRAFPANAACFWGVETARSFMDRVGF
ncbi:solute carrier family 25, member 46 [Fonticula alba]|uniref:Solute carrier family 25, member 46 n=1 Tax=Fonticula alba TaxID=691883 RepID=A0A058Z1S3_FONAL|nr:solute carrier family 25, member 46 [Fonticula alba]KCV67452.1 solute carrier family 25, member 46 [Fonticula alba]|eukprot:XP_009498128.1 solute carrier family 25, member 46 [Fonticula alba]